MNTAFYISGNIRVKEINGQIQENTITGSAFSARLGSSAVAFIPDPLNVCVAYIFLFWIAIWPLCGKVTVRLAFC